MQTLDLDKASLFDFFDIENANIMKRANIFSKYAARIRELKHDYYRRVSLVGSNPVMQIMDRHTNSPKEMVYMASNDYLNLTHHPRTIAAGMKALQKYGSGAGSVPLLGGTFDIHVELEKKIAKFKGCENAILYSSGYGANTGSLLGLLNGKDVAILDRLVHASIIDGCKATNVKFFRHNDLKSLEKILDKAKKEYRTKLIIVDGVYSMDGDIAPLDKIVELAKIYGAFVMVDEAHATGVIGKNGRGTPEYFEIEGKVDIVAGTFSKALGAVGGFVAANQELVELLHFYSRAYMFSTAPTPQVVGSLLEAINVIEDEPELRANLWKNINYFRKNLLDLGFDLGNSQTAIFPIIIGDDFKVKEACRILHERGVYANLVLYPAVPRKLARLRLSLMAAHTREHLDKALNALEYAGKKLGIV
ncbi:MAG: aminotransferase class I/II-fold pyridoxal phosphate-dependent enzyme [Candidatus Gastranaerophilales bacterium]|nr:aminotransferase class I/II-fold pyridoxal phosphate-dependent enzyme [Candidatus Gastranaerophilales bacterium]